MMIDSTISMAGFSIAIALAVVPAFALMTYLIG
jgi:hypothetical protein